MELGQSTVESVEVAMSFWKNKKVLITGHTGFKGSWLVLLLQTLGAQVIGYSLQPPTEPNLFTSAHVGTGITSIIADINDLQTLQKVFQQHRPEIVIHMAAQSLVRLSYEQPLETLRTNVLGTVNLYEAIRGCPSVKAVVTVTSDKCYENREIEHAYTETDPMGGYDPYSASKGCTELVTSAYRNSFFRDQNIAIATARSGNVVGGGDWAKDRLIPDLARALIEHHPLLIRNPQAIRPWQHVLEPLNGYLLLAERLSIDGQVYAEAWNFSPRAHDTASVKDILAKIDTILNKAVPITLDTANHPHEAQLLRLDSTKSTTRLSWRPKLTIDETLTWTMDWYLAYAAKQNVRDITLAQISAYMNKEA